MTHVVRRRIIVGGRVQGVWFRASADREAARLGVAGSAANLADGRVELIAEGPPDAVGRFTAWARLGPPRAEVTSIEEHEEPPVGVRGFAVR